MLYKPFKTEQDFESHIHMGETPEGVLWDYKEELNFEKPVKLAIDLAAFANTFGGSLLVGVKEEKINDIRVASDLASNIDVENIKKRIYDHILNLTMPRISAQVEPIIVKGEKIVAINVDPSVDLVSIRSDKDPHAYCFPYRTEYGNQYMSFKEVEERMVNNKTRSIFLKLKGLIPEKEKVMIYPVPRCNNRSEWTLEWVCDSENEVKLQRNGSKSIIVPISFIEEVWKGNVGICIKMSSRLYCGSDFIDFEDSERVENIKALSKIMMRRI